VNIAERERRWTTLMEQSLQGDVRAYEELLVSLTVGLRALVRNRARTVGVDAEDVVQETLLALHLKRGTWQVGTPVAPWVAAIARNKLIDALRRRGQRTEVSLESVIDSLWGEPVNDNDDVRDVEHMLTKLTVRQRDVVRAVSLEGYSAQEAAERLKMSEVAVRVTLHRSLKSLAALFRTVPHED
jgi:RNA polymerase sigma-70 factor (ECF subfamily)